MIDRDTALGHHLFKITQTERVDDVPPHAQQHHIDRIVEALQPPGDARSKRLSRCSRFLHRAAKAYLSASNNTSAALARQNLPCNVAWSDRKHGVTNPCRNWGSQAE